MSSAASDEGFEMVSPTLHLYYIKIAASQSTLSVKFAKENQYI